MNTDIIINYEDDNPAKQLSIFATVYDTQGESQVHALKPIRN